MLRTDKTQGDNKDTFFQYLRGLAILCVVLSHCRNSLFYTVDGIMSFNYQYGIIFRNLINFSVALFVFLSGYFAYASYQKYKDKFISKRFIRLLIPYLVWSVFYLILSAASSGEVSLIKFIYKLLTGKASTAFYYIVVLLQMTVLTPLIVKYINNKYFRYSLYLVTPVSLVPRYIWDILYDEPLPFYETFFPAWMIFYTLGLYVFSKKLQFSRRKAVVAVFIALILSLFESELILFFGLAPRFALSQLKYSSFLYVLILIYFFFAYRDNEWPFKKLITYIGDNSFGIFFVHMFWLTALEKVLTRVPYIGELLPLYNLIQLVVTILISLATIKATKMIFKDKMSQRLFGF